MKRSTRFLVASFGFGLAAACLLVAVVLIAGMTFGQRCATHFARSTPEFSHCVRLLSEGAVK